MFCRKCNQELPEESIFCSKCGCKLIDIERNDSKISSNSDLVDNSNFSFNKIHSDKADQKQNKKIYKSVIVSLVIIILIFGGIWYNAHLNSSLYEAKNLYSLGKYGDAKKKIDGLIFFGGNKEVDKIKLSGDVGWYYQFYEEEINPKYEWDTPDYARAVELLFDGLDFCLIEEKVKKADWEKEIINAFKEKYYSELNNKFDISKATVDEVLNLNYEEKNKKIKEIGNKVKEKKEALDYSRKNPFTFENTSLSSSGDYVYFRGSIKNNSDLTYKFVEVRATYYDINKNVITTDITYAVGNEGIRPGERKEFEIITRVRGEVYSGSIEIYDYSK